MEEFNIKIKGVADGKHYHSFVIDDSFFNDYNNSEIKNANILASVTLEKKLDRLSLFVNLDGKVNNMLCDICAEKISLDINSKNRIHIHDDENNFQNKDEEVLCVNPSEKEINIKHLLFEFVNLALPTKRQHKINADGTSNCNQEMLDLISKYTNPTKNMSDPRWDKLKTIK